MTNKELEQKISKAYEAATPNVLNAVLADCKKQKKEPIVAYNPMTNWGVKFAITTAAAILVILLAVGWNSWVGPVDPDTPTVPHLTNPPTGVQECTHTQTRMEGRKEPTCGADGYSGDEYCVDCGARLRPGALIPATGEHNFTPWITVPGGGSQGRWCESCLYEEIRPEGSTEPAPTLPVIPTELTEGVITDEEVLAWLQELFDQNSLLRQAVCYDYNDAREINLHVLFHNSDISDDTPISDEDRAAIVAHTGVNEFMHMRAKHLSAQRMDEVLISMFGIGLSDMSSSAFTNLCYLESTGNYCFFHNDIVVDKVEVLSINVLANGNIEVYYVKSFSGAVTYYGCVTMAAYGECYRVVCNQEIDVWPIPDQKPELPSDVPSDLITDAETVKKFQMLFSNNSWHTQALLSPYNDARNVALHEFLFDSDKPWFHWATLTEDEIRMLNDLRGGDNYYWMDGYRMTGQTVEEVLQKVFGLSFNEFSDSAKQFVDYLESTDSYYYCRTDSSLVGKVHVFGIRRLVDGNVEVYYQFDYPDVRRGIVTLRPVGDSYHIVSNIEWK